MAKGGKYAKLIHKLKRDFGHDPNHQDKINLTIAQFYEEEHEDDPKPITPGECEEELDLINLAMAQLLRRIVRSARGRQISSTYTRLYREARRVKDVTKELTSNAHLVLSAVEQILVEKYEEEGVTKGSLDTGESVGIQWEPAAKVIDREKFREWCIKNGLERSMQLPYATTNSITKEMLLEKGLEPDGVESKAKPKFVLRGAKTKSSHDDEGDDE